MTINYIKPRFFIIGERKCGTSSLFWYLLAHPNVLPGTRKEMQFFTQKPATVAAGFAHYLSQFPLEQSDDDAVLCWPDLNAEGILHEESVRFPRTLGVEYVTGEASADTFCDGSPTLLRSYLPELKLIVILRDPVERAFSHHRMYCRFRDEGRTLPFAVGDFVDDMQSELARAHSGQESAFLTPGLYLPHLKRWIAAWGRSSLLVLFTSELQDPEQCSRLMVRVQEHLNLPIHDFGPLLAQRLNRAPRADMPATVRRQLSEFYAPHDRELGFFLARALPWQL